MPRSHRQPLGPAFGAPLVTQEIILPAATQRGNLLLCAEEFKGQALIREIRLRHKNTSFSFCLTGQSLSFGAKTAEMLCCLQSSRSSGGVLGGEAMAAAQLPQPRGEAEQGSSTGRRVMVERTEFALAFVENKMEVISGHSKGDIGFSIILVTHLCCLDVRAETSQFTAELGAAWLCRHVTGLQKQL